MMHVEKMQADDFSFAVQLANTMNWNMTVDDFEFIMKLEPEGCFVLFSGAERLGICTSISFGDVGWIGNLVIKEGYRKEGAGSLLVKQAINYLKNKGAEAIGLYAYPHLTSFYGHFGFESDIDFLVLKGNTAYFPAEATVRRAMKQDIPKIIEFDKQYFGGNRKKLLEAIFLNEDNLFFYMSEDAKIAGYVVAKVYGELAEIGPLICSPNYVEVAKILLKTALAKLNSLTVSVCIPKREATLLNVLHKAGFREDFCVVRMFLGPAVAKKCIYIAESLERG